MFNNLKKRIQGGGASTPVRTLAVSGDQSRKENDNLSKDSSTDTEQAGSDAKATGSDAKAAAVTVSIPHSQTVASASTSVKPPVLSTSEVAVEQIKDHSYQNVNLNEIEELAKAPDEGYVADVTNLGVTDLQDGYSKLQSRSNLYKDRLLQVISAYKEMDGEKEQLKVSISRAEEKHRRQISELKEQIHLDSQAKRDLENNYSLMLDEKDEMIQVLRMKIKLIKDESSSDGKGSSPETTHRLDVTDESQLKEKVKRLETLLTKCKDTIKGNKERIQQLATDRDAMAKQAQEKMDELEKFKEQSSQRIADLQSELVRSQKEMTHQKSIQGGEAGQEKAATEQMAQLEDQNKLLQGKVAKLEKTGQEQLEKSREIIRQLKEQRHHLEGEVKQLQTLESRSRSEPTEQQPTNTSESNREETEEALKNKIEELLGEIEKLKAESEEKLREANSSHSSELTALQERLQLEHEKRINEIDTEHEQRLTEVAAENEKQLTEVSKRMETEFADKLEKQTALLEQQKIDAEKMKLSDDKELEEIRRRLVDLEEQAEQDHAELEVQREKGVQILEEKKVMEERVRELEGTVDSQQEVIGKAETEVDCLKRDLLTKTDEFNLTVKNYEDEIERLRKEVECKVLTGVEKNVPEIPDSEVKSMPTGFENFQQEDERKVLFDLEAEDEPKVKDEPKVEDDPKWEDKLKEQLEPSRGVLSQIEIENLELKELNKTLTDALEVERTSSRRCQDEIEQMKADAAKQLGELTQRLTSSSEMIAQMEQRMNDAMERENQLNMDLETAKIANEQNLTLRNEEIVSLQAAINELKNSAQALRDANALQNERIISLQETIDQLNASEQALKEKSALQSDEIKSLLETISQKSTSEEASKEMEKKNLDLLSDKVSSIETENEELKNSRQTLEETVSAQSKNINSLETENEELKNSRKSLEETVSAQSKNINSLENENEELKNSRKSLEETVTAQNESIISFKSENEELRNSKQALEESVASQNKKISLLEADFEELKNSSKALEETVAAQTVEISTLGKTVVTLRANEQALKEESLLSQNEEVKSLQGIMNQLRSSEQVLKETNTSQKEDLELLQIENSQLKTSEQTFKEKCASQSEEVSSLQAAIDELKSSEQALKDKNVLQSEEISLLQAAVDELRNSDQALKDKYVSQSEELSLLQAAADKLRSSEQALKDKNVSQSEELSLLQTAIDELRSSEQTLKDKNLSQSEELSLLQAAVDELRSSEQALKDKNASQSEELSLLQTAIDELRNSEQALRETIVSQSEEMKSLQALNDKLKMAEIVSKETHDQEFALPKEEIRLLQETVDKNRISEQALKQRLQDFEQQCLVPVKQTDSHLGKDVSVELMGIDPLNESLIAKQRPVESSSVISQSIGLKNETMAVSVSDNTDGSFENSDLLGMSPVTLKHPFERDLCPSLDNVQKYTKKNQQKVQLRLEHQVKTGEEELRNAYREEGQLLVEAPDQQLTASSKPLLSSGIESFSQFDEEPFQREQTVEHLQGICAKQEKRIKDLEGEVVDAVENYTAVHEKLSKLEQEKVEADVNYDEEMTLKLLEKENIMKELEQMKVSKKHFEDELQDLKQEIETCTKINSTAKAQVQKSTDMDSEEMINVGTNVNREAGTMLGSDTSEHHSLLQSIRHQYENEFDQVRTNCEHEIETIKQERDSSAKFYETRIADLEQAGLMLQEDLTILMEKLNATTKRCTIAEKAAEHYKLLALENENADLKSQFKLDMELETKQREEEIVQQRNEFEENITEAEIITGDKLKQTIEGKQLQERLLTKGDETKMLTFVPSAENVEEQSHGGKLEGTGTFDSSMESTDSKLGSQSHKPEFSAEFYEARIADLEQTGAMLQEDLTILMEKLNAMTDRYSQSEKAVEHYKQLVEGQGERDVRSQCQEDLETELKQREEEIVQLKRELEKQRAESQKLSEKLMQAVEKEKLTRKLQTHLEEFEKCGAATVGGLEQWLDVNSDRTSAGDMSRASRENVHVEHFKGDAEGVPGQHEVPDVMECQLNLLPVPLQPVLVDQSGGELGKIKSSSQLEEVPVSLKEHYEKEFKKLKSDFKSELRQHAIENNQLKELQKELLREVEVLKSSIQMPTGSDVKLYVTEPTELEYLRNILFKYMLGLETKTLAKVICTVVKFSADQTRKVLEREESRNKIFFTEPR